MPAIVVAVGVAVAVAGCGTSTGVVASDPVVITWESESGGTLGQIIVPIRNEGDGYANADVFGRGSQTVAVLQGPDGESLGPRARVQLDALPETLGPDAEGYLVATFALDVGPDDIGDAVLELNADDGREPPPVAVVGLELKDFDDGLGATGRLEWDDTGSAAARAIALDADGTPIGYVATSEVRYSSGPFEMCCFPPTVERDDIADLAIFGIRGLDEG